MKVLYHEVTKSAEASFRVLEFRGSNHPCSWHLHPGYQLGLFIEGAGHRIMGDDIAPLEAGEVYLLGPNLPHVWQFEEEGAAHAPQVHAIIVYFREDSLGAEFFRQPEAEAIRRLLNRAATGLMVRGEARRKVTALMREMPGLAGFQRVLHLLQILHLLADSRQVEPICSSGFMPDLPEQEGERLRRVCEMIQRRIAEPLNRDEIASAANLSPAPPNSRRRKRPSPSSTCSRTPPASSMTSMAMTPCTSSTSGRTCDLSAAIAHVCVAQIISEDEDDIRRLSGKQ